MRRYLLYWLRAGTLGFGLNTLIVGFIITNTDLKFYQAAPIGALFSVNLSFMADRIIFSKTTKKKKNRIGFKY